MTSASRPDPDELLARVQAEEAEARRGRLKIFFGYAAGVGKTYAMLSAARREQASGAPVLVGYVEPHGRPETEALLAGLEILPTRSLPYRGVTLQEFDLDAALARRPKLLLVDELAHSNVQGSRHAKRWQDVKELLDAGIDIWTTLNVQHIESLNDVIAQITGVAVRERLPDAVLERTDEIELVDVTPEELMLRLQAGKVYLAKQAERALEQFFQKSNLVALRELSLRQAARRLQKDVEAARSAREVRTPWATTERLLVCVGPSPSSMKIIRAAKRMAEAFEADWLAVAVNTAGDDSHAAQTRELTAQNLRLAEQLGAEAQTLIGREVADTLLEFARSRNVTKIIAGKTARSWWKQALRRSVVEQLLAESGDIDVYVISGEGEAPKARNSLPAINKSESWQHYCVAAGVLVVCGLLSWPTQHLLGWPEANTMMIFLAGIAFIATRFGRSLAVAATVASALIVDFFFLPPYGTLTIGDTRYSITFVVLLGISLLISALTARQRSLLAASQDQEGRTAKLFRMTRQLSEVSGSEFLLQVAGRQLSEFFGGESVIYLRETDGTLVARLGQDTSIATNPNNAPVARWVADHEQAAGAETDTLPDATALFIPLIGSQRTIGALAVMPEQPARLRQPDERRLLETSASLIALAIERDQSVLEAQQAQVQMQAEQLRNALLSSVSHDLRTPLTVIAAAAAKLREDESARLTPSQLSLASTLENESRQLVRLVENLLDLARFESGSVELKRDWRVLEELVGSAISRVTTELSSHEIHVEITESFPLIFVDGFLLEQAFVNLLENAAHYTPPAARIEILAKVAGGCVEIQFRDNGPGLPPGVEEKVFEKFFRAGAVPADGRRGVGLGLAICRSIVTAHGGRISATNRPSGGAQFTITLPCKVRSAEDLVKQDSMLPRT